MSLYQDNIQVAKIRSTYRLESDETSFNVTFDDGTIKQILMEFGVSDDSQIVEFYDQNDKLVARAKGFDSVL